MSTSTEIKAQAIALLTLGHACRRVEQELRLQFPGARIPHFTTIARWLREMPPNRGRAARVYWWFVMERAGEIALERMKEAEKLPPLDLIKIFAKAADIDRALTESMR